MATDRGSLTSKGWAPSEQDAMDILHGVARGFGLDALFYQERQVFANISALYLTLVPTDDYKWAAYQNRGNCYFELGGASNLRLAIADFSVSIGLKPENGRVHEDRGAAYENLGSYDAALADDTTAIQQGYVDAYDARGNVHYERGAVHNARREFEAAVADYSAYLRLSPGGRRTRIVYNNRGEAFDSLGWLARAIQDFDQALRLDPTYADAYYNRSRPEDDRGDRRGAVADLRRALALYIAQHNAVGAQRARGAPLVWRIAPVPWHGPAGDTIPPRRRVDGAILATSDGQTWRAGPGRARHLPVRRQLRRHAPLRRRRLQRGRRCHRGHGQRTDLSSAGHRGPHHRPAWHGLPEGRPLRCRGG